MKQATHTKVSLRNVCRVFCGRFAIDNFITKYSSHTVYVVSFSKEVAVRVFDQIHEVFSSKDIELRWWEETPPMYTSDASNSSASGRWQGYKPGFGFYEVQQAQNQPEHSIILLHYTNGTDPISQADKLFGSGYRLTARDSMIIPISDYLFDYESSKSILCSYCSPLAVVQTKRFRYSAPLPVQALRDVPCSDLIVEGEGRRTLGYVNRMSRYFPTLRRLRSVTSDSL